MTARVREAPERDRGTLGEMGGGGREKGMMGKGVQEVGKGEMNIWGNKGGVGEEKE